MNEELDSQLSAMFDDELPSAECELLARRLSRDGELKARWGRYAVLGAAIRAERGVRLNAALAGRVSALLITEPALATPTVARASPVRWWQPVAAVSLAAGVAALSILWLRTQSPGAPLSARADRPAPSQGVNTGVRSSSSPYIYTVPQAPAARPVVVPSTELANYVVAHSMFSSQVERHNLLSAFMTSEPGTAAGAEEPESDAKIIAH
ncbi:MAG TPA: sigma-E factor negative regulatory protein [Steroidobacteraceae bacterium]|nr:sigma-E factor negative regulatory protein [Steroidobacteraceae bacterium]